MRNNSPLGIFDGNDRFLEAIIENSAPLRETITDPEVAKEAKMQHEQESVATGNDHDYVATTKRERARQTFKGMYVDRPYVGKHNAKRKGRIVNHVERNTINRISREG